MTHSTCRCHACEYHARKSHDDEMVRERQCWHERIVEALQRVRQLDADLTAARDDNKRLVAELRELRERLSR